MCCMCHTQELYLFENQIGDTGVTALAEACARGALPQLKDLYLFIFKDAPALKVACEVRGIIFH